MTNAPPYRVAAWPLTALPRALLLLGLSVALAFPAPLWAQTAAAGQDSRPSGSPNAAPNTAPNTAPNLPRDDTRSVQLPSLGDEASEDFSVATERKLGERIMREIRRDPFYLDDPVLLEYLQSLWGPLLDAARRKGEITAELDPRLAWEMFLVRDRSVNAFALPGGYIGVHLGLIALTQSRDELASVLAHELAHVTQRHIARGFTNSRRQSLMALAGMILGVLAASRANSADGMNAAIVGSQAASIQGELNFSRELEREADRVGYTILTQGGFAPAGMAAMFERLESASRLNDSGGFPYLRSHPLTTERIGDARARVGLSGRSLSTPGQTVATAAAMAPGISPEHALAVARARVMGDTREESLRRWQRGDGVPTGVGAAGTTASSSSAVPDAASTARSTPTGAAAEALMAASSSALASVLLREPARAELALQRARAALAGWPAAGAASAAQSGPRAAGANPAASPSAQRALALLTAQVAVARGDAAAAQAALAPYDDRGNRVMLLATAEAALAAFPGAAPGAASAPSAQGGGAATGTLPNASPTAAQTTARARAEALQTWLASNPGDALAWQLSSQLWRQLGQPLRAIRADAESRYALGDFTGASDRLRAGQTAARRSSGLDIDAIEATVIDARLREVDHLRRQIFIEERGGRGPPP